jgi:hypothetical protein
MTNRIPYTKKLRDSDYHPNGVPRGISHKCVTCGDKATWGTHPVCERDSRGRLIVWEKESSV